MYISKICVYTTRVLDMLPAYGNVDIRIQIHTDTGCLYTYQY